MSTVRQRVKYKLVSACVYRIRAIFKTRLIYILPHRWWWRCEWWWWNVADEFATHFHAIGDASAFGMTNKLTVESLHVRRFSGVLYSGCKNITIFGFGSSRNISIQAAATVYIMYFRFRTTVSGASARQGPLHSSNLSIWPRFGRAHTYSMDAATGGFSLEMDKERSVRRAGTHSPHCSRICVEYDVVAVMSVELK